MAASRQKGQRENPRFETNSLQLCDLPDEILVRILSMFQQYVLLKRVYCQGGGSTCALWTSITHLQFSEDEFRGRSLFRNFVERILVLRDHCSALVSCSITCEVLRDGSRINTWITSAIRCNVEELSLDLEDAEPSYLLPSCESLVKLDLEMWNQILRVPSSFCLSNLKYLRLHGILLTDDESTEKLLSRPLLEELVIHWCDWSNIKVVNVCAPKLQELSILDPRTGWENFEGDRKVWFIGDNLKSFCFRRELHNEYCIRGSTMQLSKAELCVGSVQFPPEEDVLANRCYKLINGLSWVQNLALTVGFLELYSQLKQIINAFLQSVFSVGSC